MTFPVRILGLHPHPLFETLAYVVGGQMFWWLRRRGQDALDTPTRLGVLAGAILGAALGAKAVHLLTFLPDVGRLGWGPLLAGKSILGGLLGGHLGVEAAKALLGERRRTGDLFVLPICLAVALGRVGCFLSGLEDGTFGTPTALSWGVDFGDGLRRHPVQLYESAFLLGWGWLALRLRLRLGLSWRLFLASYCLWRVVVDGFKPYPLVLGLNAIQWVGLAGLAGLAWTHWRDTEPYGRLADPGGGHGTES